MKKIFTTLTLSVFLFTAAYAGHQCSGGKGCTACSNCKYCKHCAKGGGTCSVCK